MEDQLEEEQFGFRKGKGTRDAIGLLRTIGERYLEKNKEVYIVFMDLEKAFDRVDWNKLIEILKKIGLDWKERRLFSNLYMKQRVNVRIGEEMSVRSERGRGVRKGCPLSPILFNIYLKDLVKNCFQNVGGVIVGGKRIKCIRFADDMALLAEEEMILRDMLLELNDSCEQYGMKINANKTKTMVIGKKVKKGLHEAYADAALPYRTVARWVKAFREGRDADQDNLRTGRPRVEDNTVQLLASLLDADRRWTAQRKSEYVTKLCSTFCKTLVVQNPIILHDIARSHTAAAVKDLLHRWQWEILEHPPYSPDMIRAITIFSPK
ncbi:hypothetical protein ANN_21390 [Periplaneta americana]|uniref:Reverse transcriptase domain-containing protein n=1 Tax=Periplaneta americana TaxID=6978 RepID=A0ABQ8SGC2_PERAM|nr:hypothetical protein ANN_21390 [Periplaneta americana]